MNFGRFQRRLGAALLALSAGTIVAASPAQASTHARVQRGIEVSFDAAHPGTRVPADFLGLSFEARSLPDIAGYASSGNLPTLMRSLGRGVIRFGGITADTQVTWSDDGVSKPSWARATVGPADMRRLGALLRETGWNTLVTVNLAHYDPQAAAREASAAQSEFGAQLMGVEIGNEPDAYGTHGLRPRPWTFSTYEQDVDSYRSALQTTAPGVALAGPDSTSAPNVGWIRQEALREVPALLTAHYYSLNCADIPPPSIARLLDPVVRRKESGRLGRLAAISRANQIPLRISESNNVSCGGTAGVSNTLASALWAVDYLGRAMESGIAGVNFHGSPSNCGGYGPLCALTKDDLAAGRLHANPEWYSLLLAHELRGDRPLRTAIGPSYGQLSATAFAASGARLHVVLVNEGSSRVSARLRLPHRFARATLLRLTGPSLSATGGVTLGGRAVAGDGSWRAAPRLPQIATGAARTVPISVPAASAVLVTLSGR